MILKGLYDFYMRDKDSVPEGWMKCDLSYLVVIDGNGMFQRRIRSLEGEEKTRYVPAGNHTNSVTPQLMWDNVTYVLDFIKDKERCI